MKVKLCLPLGTDVVAELPFILMHPKPIDEPYGPTAGKQISEDGDSKQVEDKVVDENVDHNLIQLDA